MCIYIYIYIYIWWPYIYIYRIYNINVSSPWAFTKELDRSLANCVSTSLWAEVQAQKKQRSTTLVIRKKQIYYKNALHIAFDIIYIYILSNCINIYIIRYFDIFWYHRPSCQLLLGFEGHNGKPRTPAKQLCCLWVPTSQLKYQVYRKAMSSTVYKSRLHPWYSIIMEYLIQTTGFFPDVSNFLHFLNILGMAATSTAAATRPSLRRVTSEQTQSPSLRPLPTGGTEPTGTENPWVGHGKEHHGKSVRDDCAVPKGSNCCNDSANNPRSHLC